MFERSDAGAAGRHRGLLCSGAGRRGDGRMPDRSSSNALHAHIVSGRRRIFPSGGLSSMAYSSAARVLILSVWRWRRRYLHGSSIRTRRWAIRDSRPRRGGSGAARCRADVGACWPGAHASVWCAGGRGVPDRHEERDRQRAARRHGRHVRRRRAGRGRPADGPPCGHAARRLTRRRPYRLRQCRREPARGPPICARPHGHGPSPTADASTSTTRFALWEVRPT